MRRGGDIGVPDCVFKLDDALLLRRTLVPRTSRPEVPRLQVSLRGRLVEHPFPVETVFGTLEISGDPSRSETGDKATESPLDAARKPMRGLTHLVAEEEIGRLLSLDVRALLTHMSLVVQGYSYEEQRFRAKDTTWSRLDFSGSEIAFCHGDAVDAVRKSGVRGIVTLGQQARPLDSGATAQAAIALDGATLRVRRASDNLSLTFQFRRLALELGRGNAQIVSAAGLGMTDSGTATNSATTPALPFDDRPLLIAHFPPQHVAEKAYFRQIDDGISLPDPKVALNLDRLSKLHEAAEAGRDERQKYQNELKAADAADGSQTRFLELVGLLADPSSWSGKLDNAAELKSSWERLPSTQKIYLGTHPLILDPDARHLILAIWRSYRKRQDDNLTPAALDFARDANQLLESLLARVPESETDPDFARARTVFASAGAGTELAVYKGRHSVRAIYTKKTASNAKKALLDQLKKIVDALPAPQEAFAPVTSARLSGPSRLVFRVDANSMRPIPLTVDGLTAWGSFDLAVTRRAETVERLLGYRVPNATLRAPESDPARVLAYQGIAPNRSIDDRLKDIRTSLAAPKEDETAIELPFRLMLSPDQFGRFRTRRTVPREVFSSDRGFATEHLWSAHLEAGLRPPSLRAVWSPDLWPDAFIRADARPQPGPDDAPWDAPLRKVGKVGKFRASLDAFDRHQIVALTSVYGMPVLPGREATGRLVDPNQFEAPPGYALAGLEKYEGLNSNGIYNPDTLKWTELRLTALGGSLNHDTQFSPPAIANRTDGSPLFSSFSLEKWRHIAVLGRDIEVEVVYKGYLFPLGIGASLVKLTERRFMRNDKTGHVTAFLIQRMFIRVRETLKRFPAVGQPNRSLSFPVSVLEMLTKVTPDIVDPNADAGGTPEPVLGGKLNVVPQAAGRLDVLRPDSPDRLNGLVFWPRTRPLEPGNIPFQFTVNREAGVLRMPLLFVDNIAANNRELLSAIAAWYNDEKRKPLRTVSHGGISRRYAEEKAEGECHFETENWVLQVEGRVGDNELQQRSPISAHEDNARFANDPLLEGAKQPPFYPFLDSCDIRVGQAERLVGRPLASVTCRYVDRYRHYGFEAQDSSVQNPDAPKECYMYLVERLELDMGNAGDRAGGISRPAMDVRWLSRAHGIVGNQPSEGASTPAAAAASSEPDPKALDNYNWSNFFNDDAKLLGIISFKDLLNFVGSQKPELKERVDAATDQVATQIKAEILPRLIEAVEQFDQSWARAQEALESRSGGKLELATIYPEIGRSLAQFKERLQRASTAPGTELVSALSEVQQSGRRFVTAIERAAADPIAPIQEELRSQLRVFAQNIGAAGVLIQNALSKQRLRIQEDLKRGLRGIASSHPQLVFMLPAAVPPPPASATTEITQTIANAAEAFAVALVPQANRTAAAQAARGGAVAYLARRIDALKEGGAAAAGNTVTQALEKYQLQLQALTEDQLTNAVGFGVDIIQRLLTALLRFLDTAELLGSDFITGIGTALAQLLDSVVNLVLDQAALRAASNAGAWCQTQLGRFQQFTRSGLPSADAVAALVTSLEQLATAFPTGPGVTNALAQLRNASRSYRDAYGSATGDSAGACSTLNLAPLRAAQVLLNSRRTILKQTADLHHLLVNPMPAGNDAARLERLKAVHDRLRVFFPPSQGDIDPLRQLRASFTEVAPAVAPVGASEADKKVIERVIKAIAAIDAYVQHTEKTVQALQAIAASSARQMATDLEVQLKATVTGLENGIDAGLMDLMSALAQSASDVFMTLISDVLQPLFAQVLAVYDEVQQARRNAAAQLFPPSRSSPLAQILALLLSNKGSRAAEGILVVPRTPSDTIENDAVTEERAHFNALVHASVTPKDYIAHLLAVKAAWSGGDLALLRLGRNLTDVLLAVMRGDIAQFVDLEQARRQVDNAIRQLVPRRIVRSYGVKAKLTNVGELVIFNSQDPHPEGDGLNLVIRASGVVDLLEPKNSIAEAAGYLPGFKLKLLPAIDVVTLTFPHSTFYAAPGQPFTFSLRISDVQLGSAVRFLQKLQSFISSPKSGNGFYLRPMAGSGGFGIVAGYGLALGPISIGNLYISHLALNCAAELPFDKGDARFVIGIGRPEAPFIISAAPYAGAGYFGFIANGKGIIGFEASMQYGGGGGFSFGPLTGEGRISLGVFIRTLLGHTELYGLFYAGGSAQVACFSCSTSLLVRLRQSGGGLSGEAVFTFSFSIGIKDIEFAVTVHRDEPGSQSEHAALDDDVVPHTRYAIDLPRNQYAELAEARFAEGPRILMSDAPGVRYAGGPGDATPSPPNPTAAVAPETTSGDAKFTNQTYDKSLNLAKYRDYFALPMRPIVMPPPAAAPVSPPPVAPPSAAPPAKGAPAAKGPAAKSVPPPKAGTSPAPPSPAATSPTSPAATPVVPTWYLL
jgi:hypothetical protein